MSRTRARDFQDSFMRGYAGVASWVRTCSDQLRLRGYVETLRGRRRLPPGLAARGQADRARAGRQAVSAACQASAANPVKQAVLRIHARLRGLRLHGAPSHDASSHDALAPSARPPCGGVDGQRRVLHGKRSRPRHALACRAPGSPAWQPPGSPAAPQAARSAPLPPQPLVGPAAVRPLFERPSPLWPPPRRGGMWQSSRGAAFPRRGVFY